ncbi:MAG TPA: hypothetical protein VFT82_04665 [Candidatus Paceibacterota bacterium]|nr:hypothetical protein [Candidatus Paceibacterota bacterium]
MKKLTASMLVKTGHFIPASKPLPANAGSGARYGTTTESHLESTLAAASKNMRRITPKSRTAP